MTIFSEQLTVIDYIEEQSKLNAEADSILFDGEVYNRKWVLEQINKTSHLMNHIGLEQGDNIAYMSHNTADYIPTVLGCSSAGITPALINTSMRGR